jgi:hypothetical protein
MKVLHYLLIITALSPSTSLMAADQFSLGYSYWHYNVSGHYQQDGSDYNLGSGFNASNSSRALYRLRWDTGPGWWPDLAASYGRIEVSGQKNVSTNVGVGPIPIPINSTANVYTNVRDLDVTARWPWQLGWARLSLGITGKQLRGDVLISDSATGSAQTRERVNTMFPMAHAFFEVPIGSRLRIGVGGDWAALDGNEADNIVAIARLKVIGPLDLTGGWQSKHYKVRNDSYRLDTHLQGWQLGGELSF